MSSCIFHIGYANHNFHIVDASVAPSQALQRRKQNVGDDSAEESVDKEGGSERTISSTRGTSARAVRSSTRQSTSSSLAEASQAKTKAQQAKLMTANNSDRVLRSSIRDESTAIHKEGAALQESSGREGSNVLLTTVWKYGCALKRILRRNRQVILVLDHAEQLFSLGTQLEARDRVNLISQMLLLPRLLELNFSIVLVTKSTLLGQSRKYDHMTVACHLSL